MSEVQKGLIVMRSGYTLSITTPTGKRLEAMEDVDETVIIDHTDGYTQYGDGARERLKKTLRAVGTEWSVGTESDRDAE